MKPTLNEQLTRMQKLAGIIKENQQTIKEFNFDQFSSGNTSTPKASFEDKWNSIPAANKEIIKKSTGKEPIEIMASSKGMNFVITKGPDGKFYRYEYTQAEKPGEPMGPFNNAEEAKKLKENTTYTNEGEGAYEYEKGKAAGEKIEKKKMTKEKLKAQIKEMILAELNEDSEENINITNDSSNYDPTMEEAKIDEAKNTTQAAEEYYELFKEEDLIDDRREYDIEDFTLGGMDYEIAFELERMLQPLELEAVDLGSITVEGNIYDDGYISSAKFNDGKYLIADQRIELEDLLGKDEIAKLTNLNEAKKDEEVEDVTVDDTEVVAAPEADMMAGETAEVSGIQSNLQAAYAEAKALGDEKLITQIANTITYFTKAHILDTAPVNETEGNLNQVRNKLLGLFQPYGNFQISDMTMKGQNLGTEFRLYSKSKGADWKGLENFMKNNPDFSIKNISKQTFDNPKSIDFSYKTDQINENMFPMLKRILR